MADFGGQKSPLILIPVYRSGNYCYAMRKFLFIQKMIRISILLELNQSNRPSFNKKSNNLARTIHQILRKAAVILSPLLFFIVIAGSMKNSILYAIYEYDTHLFITAFCENKNNPRLHCNGKCRLVKMQREQKENESEKLLKQLQTETLACPVPTCIDFSKQEITELKNKTYPVFTHSRYAYLFSDPRKKPPQA